MFQDGILRSLPVEWSLGQPAEGATSPLGVPASPRARLGDCVADIVPARRFERLTAIQSQTREYYQEKQDCVR